MLGDGLVALLDQHLNDVVVAAWLPDSLIKVGLRTMMTART